MRHAEVPQLQLLLACAELSALLQVPARYYCHSCLHELSSSP